MAEVTSALTTHDLVLTVASAAEIAYHGTDGQEAEMIPIDAYDLARCLKVVNTAVRDFIAKGPPGGWHWRNRDMEVSLVQSYEGTATAGTAASLTDGDIAGDYADDYFNGYVLKITAGTGIGETATVADFTGSSGKFDFAALSGASTPDTTSQYRIARSTQVIDADASRYLLPQDFQGEVAGDISFIADSEACGLEWTSEGELRRLREVDVPSGDTPYLAAVKPYSTKRRWELMVHPRPSGNSTVTFPYKANFDSLTLIAGVASSASTTTLVDDTFAGMYPDNYFNGDTIRIISGTGKTSYATVTDFTGSTCTFTVADWLYQNGEAGGTDPSTDSVYYVDAGDTHPAGLEFDFAIVAACLAFTEQEFSDVKRGYMDKYLNVDLPSAWAIDGRTRPKKLGVMKPGNGPRTVYVNRGIVEYSA